MSFKEIHRGKVTFCFDDQDETHASSNLLALAALCAREQDDEALVPKELQATWLQHFSRLRENVFAWYDFGKIETVLELRAGLGETTGRLLACVPLVKAVVDTRAEAEVIAERYADKAGLEVWACACEDALKELGSSADCIIVHGVRQCDDGLLAAISAVMKPDAQLLLLAENALSCKELASVHLRDIGPFDLHNRKEPAGLHTRSTLCASLAEAGFLQVDIWYPYPDAWFTRHVFSDAWMPHGGELSPHEDPALTPRAKTHSDNALCEAFTREGVFSVVAPAFFVRASRGGVSQTDKTSYAKISNERTRDIAIATTISENRRVAKIPLYPEGAAHVSHLADICQRLEQAHHGELVPGAAHALADGTVEFDFLEGPTLDTEIIRNMVAGQEDDVRSLLERYRRAIMDSATESFRVTDEFVATFGGQADMRAFERYEGAPCLAVTDIDLIMSNIVIVDGTWMFIDYEWTFDFPIPAKFVLWRALFYLLYSETAQRYEFDYDLYPSWDLGDEDRDTFFKMEVAFQQHLTGGMESPDEVLRRADSASIDVLELLEHQERQANDAASEDAQHHKMARRSLFDRLRGR